MQTQTLTTNPNNAFPYGVTDYESENALLAWKINNEIGVLTLYDEEGNVSGKEYPSGYEESIRQMFRNQQREAVARGGAGIYSRSPKRMVEE